MKKIFLFALVVASFAVLAMDGGDKIGVKFDHKLHLQDIGAECADCHAAAESKSPADNLMPGHDNCYSCHDENETECGYCHTNGDDPFGVPHVTNFIAKFPHDVHIEQDVKCITCHQGIAFSEKAATQHLPSMALCQTCHSDLEEANYCQRCHNADEKLAPVTHNLDWRQAHGLVNHLNEESCASCHTEQQCLDCHQGDNLDRTVHPFNYVNNHAIDARNKRDNCYTCHEELETCVSCHRDQLVLPRSHNTAGWSNLSNGGRHAREARMDLDNCLVCHNDNYGEPVCAQCHSANN